MISHKYKCIFIHIPKCAGTSIESALGHLDNHQGRDGQDHRSVRMIEQPFLTVYSLASKENIREILERMRHQFRTARNPRNKLTVTRKQFKEYYKFAIVRNPWARAFSWYQNVMKDEIHKKNYEIFGDMPFKDFLVQYAGKGMLQPQTYWLKNFDGSIRLDYIGRFETLTEDFRKICRELNISHIKLPHERKGTGLDHTAYYDNETIRIVSEIYSEEIALFDYTFNA